MINVPLLEKTLHHIEAHPEEWNQEFWVCDTGMCFAGHAAYLAGFQFDESGYAGDEHADDEHISEVACTELGLDYEQAGELFKWINSLDDLRRIVTDLIAEAES